MNRTLSQSETKSFRIFSSKLFRNILKDFNGLYWTHYEQQKPPSFIIWIFFYVNSPNCNSQNGNSAHQDKAHSSGLPSASCLLPTRPFPSQQDTERKVDLSGPERATLDLVSYHCGNECETPVEDKERHVWTPADVAAV